MLFVRKWGGLFLSSFCALSLCFGCLGLYHTAQFSFPLNKTDSCTLFQEVLFVAASSQITNLSYAMIFFYFSAIWWVWNKSMHNSTFTSIFRVLVFLAHSIKESIFC